MFNDFEMTKRTLNFFLRIFLRTCKTVSRKPCMNREDKSKITHFSYTFILIKVTTKLPEVVIPPYIYH